MDKSWAPELIANYIEKYCKQKESIDGPEGKIHTVITFDEHGISSHPNHIAIFHGMEHLMTKQLVDVEMMALITVNLIRKYLGFLDILFIWIT